MYELAKKQNRKKRENKLGNREILNQMCKTFLTIYKKNYEGKWKISNFFTN